LKGTLEVAPNIGAARDADARREAMEVAAPEPHEESLNAVEKEIASFWR
jgi:hypothetical protein